MATTEETLYQPTTDADAALFLTDRFLTQIIPRLTAAEVTAIADTLDSDDDHSGPAALWSAWADARPDVWSVTTGTTTEIIDDSGDEQAVVATFTQPAGEE